MKRTSVILLSAGALVAAITGTALAGGNQDATPTRSASSAPTATASGTATEIPTPSPTADVTADVTVSPTTPANAAASVSSGRAGEIALAHVGGGTITEIESEVEHGRTAWSVKILRNGSRYKVYVDRSNGQITRAERKSDDDGPDDHHRGGDDDRSGSEDHGGHHGDGADDHRGGSDD
ncbi:PepSY domain-containing protein [Streptomyces sp. NPDC050535]|uniref:PepSY domain-containing protein n=1 Tax=Streptomyces sp. NPDC050535 TaxID=3365626 RepID=UPI0037B2DACC